MTSQNERILLIINHFCEGNKAEFARRVGELPQTVSGWLKRENGLKVLNKILEAFNEVNSSWLITGEGEMLKSEEKPEIIQEGNIIKLNLKPKETVQLDPRFGGFTEKLRMLGYDEPKEISGYKAILAQVLTDASRNPTAFAELISGVRQPPTLTEQMVDMITKPLVKQLREAERVIAEKEMIIAKYEAQAKKDVS